MRFSLFPFRSPLLRESRLLSLPAGTEMFHFPALPPAALCIQAGATAHDGRRVSPFGNPRITAWLPAPRGLSQAPTSFFGSWYQGIHRVPLKTWLHIFTTKYAEEPPRPPKRAIPEGKRELQVYRCSRPLCSSQETDSTTGPHPSRGDGPRPVLKTRAEARFLRTQQRAHPEPRPASPVPHPEGNVLARRKNKDPGE
jgi:hypothetical protein